MKRLEFQNNEVSKKRFEVLLHGLVVQGNVSSQKGLVVLRREISLLDKLEGISKPCECGKTLPGLREPDRELDFSDGSFTHLAINIDDPEFDLLYDYISKVPWALGPASRLALSTLDWLKDGSSAS